MPGARAGVRRHGAEQCVFVALSNTGLQEKAVSLHVGALGGKTVRALGACAQPGVSPRAETEQPPHRAGAVASAAGAWGSGALEPHRPTPCPGIAANRYGVLRQP